MDILILRKNEKNYCSSIIINIFIIKYTKYLKLEDDLKDELDKLFEPMLIDDKKKLTEYDVPTFMDTKKFLGDWCLNVDFIKINSLEHEKNFERLPEYPDLLDKLIITKGKYGCEYKSKIHPTEEVPVKDVSGAGDTFMSGLVFEYIKSKDIEKAIDFAQECTTKVVQKSGVSTI